MQPVEDYLVTIHDTAIARGEEQADVQRRTRQVVSEYCRGAGDKDRLARGFRDKDLTTDLGREMHDAILV
jgi:hypothetical protein